MRTLKLFLPFALIVVSLASNAQETTANVEKKQETTVQPQQPQLQLNLTREQQIPHRELIKRYAELAREVRKSVLTPEEKKAKLNVLNLQREAELKALLSPEQYQTHLKIIELQKSRMIDMKKKAAPGSVNAK